MTTSPADHFRRIYSSRADAYQRMVAAEDVGGNLRSALYALAEWRARRVVDLDA